MHIEAQEIDQLLNKAQDYERLKNYQLAFQIYQSLILSYPNDLKILQKIGQFLLLVDNLSNSLEIYDRCLQIDPSLRNVWIIKGQILQKLNQQQDALYCFQNAILLDQTNPEGFIFLGKFWRDLKNYETALVCFDQAISFQSDNYISRFAKGGILFNLKKYEDALFEYEQCLKIDPSNNESLYNKAACLHHLQKNEEALEIYKNLLIQYPNSTDILSNKARVLFQLEKFDLANFYNDQILHNDPNNVAANFNKGFFLRSIEKNKDAVEYFDRCLSIDPTYYSALVSKVNCLIEDKKKDELISILPKLELCDEKVVEVLFCKACIYLFLEKFDLAQKYFDETIATDPDFSLAYLNKALLLNQIEDYENSIVNSLKFIEIDPNHVNSYETLGLSYCYQKKYEKAIEAFTKGISIKNDQYNLWLNLGSSYYHVQNIEKALYCLEKAIKINDKDPLGYWNKALINIANKNYDIGFKLYDWRFQIESLKCLRPYFKPYLQTDDVKDKTIFLYHEQGYGDNIQFSRFAIVLKNLGAKVYLQVPKDLKELAKSIDKDIKILTENQEPPFFDYHAPIVSVVHVLKTTVYNIPYTDGYFSVSNEKKIAWKQKLLPTSKPKVGFCFAGSRSQKSDLRCINLEEFVHLFSLPIEFHCLQKDLSLDEIDLLQKFDNVFIHSKDLTDFSETAALMENLDLIISIDTAVAHLAGALNKKCWILLSNSADYRWHILDNNTPWYKSVELFRQDNSRIWDSLIIYIFDRLKIEFYLSDELFQYSLIDHLEKLTLCKMNGHIEKFIQNYCCKLLKTKDAILSAAVYLKDTQQYLSSLEMCDHGLAQFPKDKTILMLKAEVSHFLNDLQRCLQIYQDLTISDPNNFDAYKNFISILMQLKNFSIASNICDQFIKVFSDSYLPYLLQSICLFEEKKFENALLLIDKSLFLDENQNASLYQKAVTLLELNRFEEALVFFDKALFIDPHNYLAIFSKAICLKKMKKNRESLDLFLHCYAVNPSSYQLMDEIACLYYKLEEYEIAISYFDKLIDISPLDVEAMRKKGSSLHRLRKFYEAIEIYKYALSINESSDTIFSDLAAAFYELHQYEEALHFAHKGLQINPNNEIAWINFGSYLLTQGKVDEAVNCFRQLIDKQIKNPDLFANYGICCLLLKNPDDGLFYCDQGLKIDPFSNTCKWNKSLILIAAKEYLKGFELYEARLAKDGIRKYSAKFLDTEDVKGKTVFLYKEQGFGDVTQFCRYALVLKEKGANVILEVQNSLVDIISSISPDIRVISANEKVEYFDFFAPIMSCAHILKTQVENVPFSSGYLKADKKKIDKWAKNLGDKKSFRIGFSFQGSRKHKFDVFRSISFNDIAEIFDLPCEFHCLQREILPTEFEFLAQFPNVSTHFESLVDFSETAALIENMDLIISVDSILAHLSGALNKKCWLLLNYYSEFRWHIDGDSTPWYDSMKILRKAKQEPWNVFINKISQKILKELSKI